MALAQIDPEVRELTEAGGQNLIARRQRVRDRRFPTACAGPWKQEHLTGFRLEDLLQILEQWKREIW